MRLDRDAAARVAVQRDIEAREGRFMGPLHGVPIALKDIFDAAGVPTTAGAPAWATRTPAVDAPSVAALRGAGAVPMGKLATTPFAYLDPSATRNPWNPEHTPGGSSSGPAAAVAARMVPLALGSQTVGSVLRPAAYCGVVGLKPTHGRISAAGVLELAGSLDHVGVFARAVEDCALALAVLAGGDPAPDDYVGALTEPAAPRLGVLASFLARATPEMGKHLEAVTRGLEAAGARLEDVTLPAAFASIHDVGATVLRAEAAAAHAPLFAAHAAEYPPKIKELIELGHAISAPAYLAAQAAPAAGARGGGGDRRALRRLPPADHRRPGAPRARLDGRSVVLRAVELPRHARHHAADRGGGRPAAGRPARGRPVERGAAAGGGRLVRARDRLHRRPAALRPRA